MADAHIPDKPALEGLEAKWDAAWQEQGTYLFDRVRAAERGRAGVYSVDTPPPTASGSLHIGHVFSYTHTDVKVRFERMRGKTVFYPMGWDDNGLPTERRVQNYYGVRCDPSLPYQSDFTPPFEGGDNKSSKAADQMPISRRNFIELCESLTVEDEKHFEALFRSARAERRLDADLPHDLGRHDPHEPARVPAQPRARRGVPGARADAVGHRLPLGDRAGRARGPRPARRVPPRRIPQDRRLRRRAHRDDAARAARRVRRARRAPRRRALPAAVRLDGAHTALRRRGAGARAPARAAGQGLGHRDDLHVRRCDRHHLVARARPAQPHDPRARTAASWQTPPR